MADCCSNLALCIPSLVTSIGALVWCLKIELNARFPPKQPSIIENSKQL
jgi:hypothetical protein